MTEAVVITAQEAPASTTTEPETVQTEQDTPQAEASTQQEPSEAEKLKAAYEKRISRITAARHAEARRADEYAKKLEAYQKPAQTDDGSPKESDFATVEDYNKALGRWEAQQEFAKKEAEAKQKEAETQRQAKVAQLQKAHEAKEAEIRKQNPRYDENASVVNEAISLANRDTPEFKAFADAMITSDNMAAVTNFLGENPDRIEALFSMNPAQIYREIARIELQLATPPEPEEETEVKLVPTPPKPIGGTGKVSRPLDKMSAKELVKWSRK